MTAQEAYYITVIHPAHIINMTPKEQYRYQRHVERWERRYRAPYPFAKSEVGEISGVTFYQLEDMGDRDEMLRRRLDEMEVS